MCIYRSRCPCLCSPLERGMMGTRLLHWLSEFCVSVIVLACLSLALAGCNEPHVSSLSYYVSPTGSDNNPGTISRPFRTSDHARMVVQGINKPISGDILVFLRAGTNALSQTLTFRPSHSWTKV